MSDTGSYRFSPEARALLRDATDFFTPLVQAAGAGELPRLLGKDVEAKTEARRLPNGDREVTWIYPIDDNPARDDGRIYLYDTFTFDADERVLKDFRRVCTEPTVETPRWRAYFERCQRAAATPGWGAPDPGPRRFARWVARGYGRAFAENDGELSSELFAALQGQGDYLRDAGDLARRRRPGWKLKFGDPESRYRILPRRDSFDLILTVAVDSDADPANGRIYLQERFLLDASGELLANDRKWVAVPEGEPGEDGAAPLLQYLNRFPPPEPWQAKAFLRDLLPQLLPGKGGAGIEALALLAPARPSVSPAGPPEGKIAAAAFAWDAFKVLARELDASPALESLLQQAEAAAAPSDSTASPLARLGGLGVTGSLREARDRLLQDSRLQELDALAGEADETLRAEAALRLAQDRLLSEGHCLQSAVYLATRLQEVPATRRAATALLEVAQGRGSFGQKFGAALPAFSREVAKPSMLLGMAAAPFLGIAAEWGGLRLAAWGLEAKNAAALGREWRWGAALLGMSGEALGFTAIHRGLAHWEPGPNPGWDGAGHEVLASILMFGAFRSSHFAADWARTRVAAVEASRASRIFSGFVQHGGGIAAMNVANFLSRRLGWMPDNGQGAGGHFFDAALSYLQATAGAGIANAVSGGRLLPWQAALREGLRGFRPAAPAAPVGSGLGLSPDKIPSLRLFDLNQGNVQSDFHLGPGREASLDPLLFGNEGNKIRLFQDAAGNVFVEDRRDRVLPWRPGAQGAINFREQAILHNSQVMPAGRPVRLEAGDFLFFPIRHLKISLPRHSELFSALAAQPDEVQQSFADLFRSASDPAVWREALEQSPNPAARLLGSEVENALAGRALLYGLPTELGIQAAVDNFMQAKVRDWSREGWLDTSFRLRPELSDARWSPFERTFHALSAVESLRNQLRDSRHVDEILGHLQNSPLDVLDDRPVPALVAKLEGILQGDFPGLRALPSAAGLRQRVSDLAEAKAIRDFEAYLRNDSAIPLPEHEAWREEYIRLDGKRFEIFAKIRRGIPQDDPDSAYTPDQLEERLYQVLERGRPLAILPRAGQLRREAELYQQWAVRSAKEMFPLEMAKEVDPWSGEAVDAGDQEAQYRLALHVLNVFGRRPITGMPSSLERAELHRLVTTYLDTSAPPDYLTLQATLRRHFDGATPQIAGMLRQVSAVEKSELLHHYFGTMRRRDLNPANAFQIAVWLGQSGMYREAAVAFEFTHGALRPVLSLGEMDRVSSEDAEDLFLIHIHPELYLDAQGQLMGFSAIPGAARTIAIEVGKPSRETTHMIPSMSDLRLHLYKAKEYVRLNFPRMFGKTALYDPETRVYRNWLAHPFALSEFRVSLGEAGQVLGMEVRFAPRGYDKWNDDNFIRRKAGLENLSGELGIPVQVVEVPYDEMVAAFPYPIRPLL